MKKTGWIILTLAVLLCLLGCKSKKVVIQESSTLQLTDTTKYQTDSLVTTEQRGDSLVTTEQRSDSLGIVATTQESSDITFVDGGGTVSIDSAGNLSLQGVKSIKAGKLSTWREEMRAGAAKMALDVNKTIKRTDSVATTQHNGIKRDEATQRKEKTKTRQPGWYVPIAIVGTVCLAVLLWLIFMYLKRKL